MAGKSKGQGEKSGIPPHLAAVLHGPVPKPQLAPIDKMEPSQKLSDEQLKPRDGMKRKSKDQMQPQPRHSRSSFDFGDVTKLKPRFIQGMQTQSEHSMSSLRLRNVMESMSTEEIQPKIKRSMSPLGLRNVMEPRSIDKIQLKPRSTKDTQPRHNRSKSPSSFRTLKDISTTSTDKGSTKRKCRRQTFHKFPALPLELQTMIWQWYGRIHANSTPNIIIISHLQKEHRRIGPGLSERGTDLTVRCRLPPIFYVSKFSLKIAKELYEKEYQVIPMTQNDQKLTYFNEDKDIIVLENSNVLMNWRYNRQTDAESSRRIFITPSLPAAGIITRRINMKHLVIGGTDRSLQESRLLARFYDCESIMLGVPYLIRGRFFFGEKRNEPDRVVISYLRHLLCFYWDEERQGPFVREDYRGKPIRPAVVEPSWDPTNRTISNPMFLICSDDEIMSQLRRLHPAITNFLTPLPAAKSSINFMSDLKFSHKHAMLFEHPWEFVPKL
ncbi:hypothetical protein ACHAPC_006035 [Botrytis cinerea]